ncbi:L-aspartate oxidase [Novacetimonas pomaceti]|uniref:L-aspartate oxidase n=1 Tax=Novacetimonas pomaceti TaxID=2021998 RepID=UPI001C2DB8F8|nr:L-aspartate oxidase [Novacetimonas pomaceti]MBV1832769.1 L-aspartate oxidase [Novacetimonas pomaceti]
MTIPDLRGLAGQPVIVGGGLAGVMTALMYDRPCVLLSSGPLGASHPAAASSMLAQGGIAAAVGADDTPALHAADTLAAGAGLCDPDVVERVTADGPDAIARLAAFGVRFDRAADGTLVLGLEAAHSRHRIVHARGDASGAAIMEALVARVRRTPRITVLENARVHALESHDGVVAGARVTMDGRDIAWPAPAVVLATGGIGGLFGDTTNPLGAVGQGLALAARAGAVLGNMEFVQFHPTALAARHVAGPMPLISEAVRGEGAVLIDEGGERFTAELAARDIVSRAVWRHMRAGHHVFLDARQVLGTRFATRFPAIDALCRAQGIDPARQPIPVRPAAHYHMGGIVVDGRGRSTVPGLWACGEVACTGLHGANRLASNSLLEAVSFGTWVARDLSTLAPVTSAEPPRDMGAAATVRPASHEAWRRRMARDAGVIRTRDDMREALRVFAPLADGDDGALVRAMVLCAALRREESRGGHFRADFPQAAAVATASRLTLADVREHAATPAAKAGEMTQTPDNGVVA